MLRAIRASLRNKVTLLVLAVALSALMLSGLGLAIYDLQAYERQSITDLSTQADVLARAAAPALSFNDPQAATKDLSVMRVRSRVLAAALYTRDGELFATYLQKDVPVRPFPMRPGTEGPMIEGGEMVLTRPVIENNERIGSVHLRALYDPWSRLVDYLSILAVVMVASLLVAAFLSRWMQAAVTAPILEVAGVARQVMERRDYTPRARKTTEDEIGQLVDAFNAMLAEIGRRADALREADQRKDEFLATLAHELRNPLAPLRNALEILRIAGNDAVKAQKAREMMERQLAQMVRLVDDLLDVSRITTGKLAVRKSTIDLRGAVRDAVETVRPFIEQRRHQLELDLVPDPIAVQGDRTRLTQVIGNLLNNAAKYTEPGGRIALSAKPEGRSAVVRVRDNGIGLTPEAAAAIFDMFVQIDRSLERSQAGLGVGLTLARRLVELHDGSIEAHSEGLGRGSEFVVRLPLSPARPEEGARPRTEEGAERPSRRILLADDNADFANSLAQLLAARGHEVRVAYDGVEALDTAAKFAPEVAFLDIGMPKVHGYEVARRLRAQPETADCVLVAVTGWGQENDRRRSREAGFDHHLVKPVDADQIESFLETH